MRRTARYLLLPTVALLLCAPLLADSPRSSFDKVTEGKPQPSTTVRGTVVATGGRTLAIETPAGNRMDFELDPAADLSPSVVTGAEVLVTYGPRETGVSRVLRVAPVQRLEPTEPVGRVEPAGVVAGHGAEAPAESESAPSAKSPRPASRKSTAAAVALGLGVAAGTVAIWVASRTRA